MKFKQILAGTLATAMVFTSVPMAGNGSLSVRAAEELEIVDNMPEESNGISVEASNTGRITQFSAAETPVNVALRADIVAWSGQETDSGHVCAVTYVNDGRDNDNTNNYNRWLPTTKLKNKGENEDPAAYVVFDLGKDVETALSEIKVRFHNLTWATDYQILTSDSCSYENDRLTNVSTDGWEQVAQIRARTGVGSYHQDIFTASDMQTDTAKRYVMFYFTGMNTGAGLNSVSIREIEVWGVRRFQNYIKQIPVNTLVANARANSEQNPARANGQDGPAIFAFDENNGHWWHSRYNGDGIGAHENGAGQTWNNSYGQPGDNNPIWIQTGFGTPKTDDADAVHVQKNIRKVTYQSRGVGCIDAYALQIADMTVSPETKDTDGDGYPDDAAFETVKSGHLNSTSDEQEIFLATPVAATHVRLVVSSVHNSNNNAFVAAKSIKVYEEKADDSAIREKLQELIAEKEAFDSAIYTGVRGIEAELQAAKDTLANENATVDELRAQIDSLSAVSGERYVEDGHGTAVYLSDLDWMSDSTTGYGNITKDRNLSGNAIELWKGTGLQTFAKGLAVHANATVNYDISGKDYQIFTAYVGVDGGQSIHGVNSGKKYPQGTFTVEVSTDGHNYTTAWTSHEKHSKGCDCGAEYKDYDYAVVDVSGANYVRLKVVHGGVDYNGHMDWADARFYTEVNPYTATVSYTSDSDYSGEDIPVMIPTTGYTHTASFQAAEQAGYTFVGWYDSEDGTTKVSDENPYSQVLWGNTTLYAKYMIPANKEALETAIAEKQAVMDATDFETTYTPASIAGLQAALAEANEVMGNAIATQEEVDRAAETLNTFELIEYDLYKHSDFWDREVTAGTLANQTPEDAWYYQIRENETWSNIASDQFRNGKWLNTGGNAPYHWAKLDKEEMTPCFNDNHNYNGIAYAWQYKGDGHSYVCVEFEKDLSVLNAAKEDIPFEITKALCDGTNDKELLTKRLVKGQTYPASDMTSDIAKINTGEYVRIAALKANNDLEHVNPVIVECTAQQYAVQYLPETVNVENGNYTDASKQAVIDARDALQAAAGADDPDMADIDAKITVLETAIANLEEYVAVTSISLSQETASLTVGDTLELTATIAPENATNQDVTWTTSNASAATVSNGVVTAKGVGTATITAAGADGAVATCVITVSNRTFTVTVEEPGYIDNPDDSSDRTILTKEVEYMHTITIRAPKVKENGDEFVGWKEKERDAFVSYSSSYTMYVRNSITLTPVYEAPEEDKIPDAISSVTGYYKEKSADNKNVFHITASRVVPAAATRTGKVDEQGFLISTKEIAEDALVLDANGNVPKDGNNKGLFTKKAGKTTGLIGSYVADVKTKNPSIYLKSYVIYTDKAGVKHIIYSDMEVLNAEN